MKAAPFDYTKPTTLAEAVSMKQRYGNAARFLAGGQSLLPAMNMRFDRPELLIDINGLDQLDGISEDARMVRIGALTRASALGASPLIAQRLPLLAQCVKHIAHPAIRTLATFGGSVALADPAAEWPAACLALDATIVALGPTGERAIAARDFFRGLYTTALAENELLTRIELPAQPKEVRTVALEIARRRGDFAIAGILAQAKVERGDMLEEPRVAFFGIADRPIRLTEVERHLAASGRNGVAAAKAALVEGCTFTSDLYNAPTTKQHLAGVLLSRAIEQLLVTEEC